MSDRDSGESQPQPNPQQQNPFENSQKIYNEWQPDRKKWGVSEGPVSATEVRNVSLTLDQINKALHDIMLGLDPDTRENIPFNIPKDVENAGQSTIDAYLEKEKKRRQMKYLVSHQPKGPKPLAFIRRDEASSVVPGKHEEFVKALEYAETQAGNTFEVEIDGFQYTIEVSSFRAEGQSAKEGDGPNETLLLAGSTHMSVNEATMLGYLNPASNLTIFPDLIIQISHTATFQLPPKEDVATEEEQAKYVESHVVLSLPPESLQTLWKEQPYILDDMLRISKKRDRSQFALEGKKLVLVLVEEDIPNTLDATAAKEDDPTPDLDQSAKRSLMKSAKYLESISGHMLNEIFSQQSAARKYNYPHQETLDPEHHNELGHLFFWIDQALNSEWLLSAQGESPVESQALDKLRDEAYSNPDTFYRLALVNIEELLQKVEPLWVHPQAIALQSENNFLSYDALLHQVLPFVSKSLERESYLAGSEIVRKFVDTFRGVAGMQNNPYLKKAIEIIDQSGKTSST
jgi:hypothetical protein